VTKKALYWTIFPDDGKKQKAKKSYPLLLEPRMKTNNENQFINSPHIDRHHGRVFGFVDTFTLSPTFPLSIDFGLPTLINAKVNN